MKLPYRRSEAKDWARQELKGVCNVLMPTFTSNLRSLNEAAIRHDLRRCIEHGFSGTLLVSECGTTIEEMKRFIDIAVDEHPAGFQLVLHGSFDTLEDTVAMSRYSAERGVEAMLLAYPLNFYPKDGDDIYDFTAEVARGTDQALILFAVTLWGYRRLDPRGFPLQALHKMADLDTAVALKYEVGGPGNGGMVEAEDLLGDRLVVSAPFEHESPAWVKHYGMRWLGTSNYEYTADCVPKMFDQMMRGEWKKAMEIYWSIQPAREAKGTIGAVTFGGANLVHRPAWKYMSWLSGYNGGPLRMPQMRLDGKQMGVLRRGLEASGIEVTPDPDENFFVGRNPA